MKTKRVLLLYKKTVYAQYKDKRIIGLTSKNRFLKSQFSRIKKAHEEHNLTLKFIKKILKENDISYKSHYRGGQVSFDRFDVVITVGGDGTFLKAAASTKKQVIIGVNSAMSFSVGRLCVGNISNFKRLVNKLMTGQYQIKELQRLNLKMKKKPVN